MTNQVIFQTPTKMPLEVITTFGVSVKFGDNPIGQFGTGLKYAIAIILRHGLEIEMTIGQEEYLFTTRRTNIRGEMFEKCFMVKDPKGENTEGIDLPFTTELGKHWELWMAFRELYSNTCDERGTTSDTEIPTLSGNDYTTIRVIGDEFHQIFLEKADVFIDDSDDEDMVEMHDLELYSGETKFVYNRGIRVAEFDYPLMHRYNIPSKISLTEDRTIKSSWDLDTRIISNVIASQDEDFIRRMLLAESTNHESRLDFTQHEWMLQSTFLEVLEELCEDEDTVDQVNAFARKYYFTQKEKERKRRNAKKATYTVSFNQPEDIDSDDIIYRIESLIENLIDSDNLELEVIKKEE